jgi:aminopeptidase N
MKNAYNRVDRSTYSNPTEVLSTVVHLEWDLNFDTKIICGSATHSMVVIAHQGAEFAKFDSSGIKVTQVEVNSHPVQFTFGESSKALGNCLVVPIPPHLRNVGDEFDVKFHYSTSPNASAAQWLSAKATRSGNYVCSHESLFPSLSSSHFCSLNAKPSMPEAYFLVKIHLVSKLLTQQLSRRQLGQES